jgi:hypothetical protein
MFKGCGFYVSFGVALALAGCQSVCRNECVGPMPGFDYSLTIADDPAQERLHVTVTSKAGRQMCLGREWPSSGALFTEEGASTGVYLFVGQRIFAYESREYSGYCTELHCFNPLRAGEHRDGYFSYAAFGLPESDFAAAKSLKFKPQPFWCR